MLVDTMAQVFSYCICGGTQRNLMYRVSDQLFECFTAARAEARRLARYLFGPCGWHYIDFYGPCEFKAEDGGEDLPYWGERFIDREINLDWW